MKKNIINLIFSLTVLCYMPSIQAQAQFSDQKVIISLFTSTYGATDVYSADLDGDGDMDVLSASKEDGKIAWYENDGSGNFGPQQIISTSVVDAGSVYACDLDGDGDMDVLSASGEDDKIAWYENDGLGSFGAQQIISTSAKYPQSVYASDLDGDGDMDVLSASSSLNNVDNKIAWYENDGSGSFGDQQIITTSADGAKSVYASDLDGDGDLDVLSASSDDNKIAWYENDSSGSFGAQQIISAGANEAQSVYACDLDGDSDMDVLSASWGDNKIAWYENLMGSTDIKNNAKDPVDFSLYQNYPNPFNPVTMINYQLPMINDVELNIYNLIGKKVATLVSERQSAGAYQVEWDATDLASGVYYYQLKAGEFREVKKMVLVKQYNQSQK